MPEQKLHNSFHFNKVYFLFALLLFIVEVLIALYLNDAIIRPFIGDFIVVILIYCFCKSFLRVPVLPLAFSVLLFSYFIELTQYFKLLKHLGLHKSTLAKIILGNSFSWWDIVNYTAGVFFIIVVEKARKLNSNSLQ